MCVGVGIVGVVEGVRMAGAELLLEWEGEASEDDGGGVGSGAG